VDFSLKKTGFRQAVFLLLVLFAHTGTAQQDANPQDLKRLESAIEDLQRELGRHRGKYGALEAQLRKNEVAIGNLSTLIRANRKKQAALEQELTSLRSRRRQLEQDRNKQQVLIAAQLRSAYQLGQEKTLKVLLNQEDPALISRALTYVDYFNKARMREIDQFNNTLTELRALEPAIVEKSATLKQTGQQLATEKSTLGHQQKARQQTLASLSQTIKTKDAQLQQHEKDQARLEALLNTVEDVAASFASMEDARPFGSLKGKMKWPARGKIVNRFSRRRQHGGLKWQGVEIRGKEGNKITAIHHGRVVFADWLGGQGLLIVIDHGDGYMSLYGHNQSLLHETGDWIRTGEIIATMGNSGGRSQTGLYFEIRHKGKARNPAGWCRS
jgi:septal ring factor EnvC (AmiA/AmiB activator)